MNFLIVSDKNFKEKEEINKKGLFCYDLRTNDDGDKISTIEKSVKVNKIGSIITDKKLEFNEPPYDFIDFDNFILENKQIDTLQELLSGGNLSDTFKKRNKEVR